jgi:hypothetical protein
MPQNLETLKMAPQIRTSFQPTRLPSSPPPRIPSSPIDYSTTSVYRRQKAKQWLEANPAENVVTASRLYKVNYDTLKSSIKRPKRSHGGHNKILQDHQTKAIHTFIRDLLSYGIQPTMTLVFQAICALKKASNPSALSPTKAWFGKWWKENRLHKIKSKPLAALRITAQDETEIQLWFRAYIRTIERLQIQRRNILNFDETGFRIGCPKGQTLLVPEDVLEVRTILFNKIVTNRL